jgi:ankyrin repeat protein
VVQGTPEEVHALLIAGEDVNLADRGGLTPLHFAAQERRANVAGILLAAGAEVDAEDRNGNTPLSTAVFYSEGDGRVINLLRAAGADPWRANHHAQTPVGLARLIGNYDIARFFADVPQMPP